MGLSTISSSSQPDYFTSAVGTSQSTPSELPSHTLKDDSLSDESRRARFCDHICDHIIKDLKAYLLELTLNHLIESPRPTSTTTCRLNQVDTQNENENKSISDLKEATKPMENFEGLRDKAEKESHVDKGKRPAHHLGDNKGKRPDNDNTEDELDVAKKEISELKKYLKKERSELQKHYADAELRLKTLEEAIEERLKQHKSHDNKIKQALRKQIKKLENDKGDLEKKVADLQGEKVASGREVTRLEETNGELEKERNKLQERVTHFQATNNELEKERGNLQEELNRLQDERQGQIINLQENNDQLRGEIDDLRQDYNQIQQNNNQLRGEIDNLRQDYNQIQQNNDQLRDEIDDLRQDYNQIQQNNNQLRGEIDNLRQNYNQIQQNNDQLRGEIDDLRQDYNQIQQDNEQSQARLQEQEHTMRELLGAVLAHGDSVAQQRDDSEALNVLILEELDRLNANNNALAAENLESQTRIVSLEERLQRFSRQGVRGRRSLALSRSGRRSSSLNVVYRVRGEPYRDAGISQQAQENPNGPLARDLHAVCKALT